MWELNDENEQGCCNKRECKFNWNAIIGSCIAWAQLEGALLARNKSHRYDCVDPPARATHTREHSYFSQTWNWLRRVFFILSLPHTETEYFWSNGSCSNVCLCAFWSLSVLWNDDRPHCHTLLTLEALLLVVHFSAIFLLVFTCLVKWSISSSFQS